ncbi:MAG TPA: glutaminase [Casimicrobium sp.]|jgi:glutaminase|nr:glutaminase [Casimicrobium sp.]
MNYQPTLDRIYAALQPVIGDGKVASYIPELASVSPDQFGMAVVDFAGNVFAVGDATKRFSIQSISKLFALTLAFQREGDSLWSRVGREPSGNPFNSLVQLEREQGIPRNPFINAGALVITDMLAAQYDDPQEALLNFVRDLANAPGVQINGRVGESEVRTSSRNAAMAHFMKSFGNLNNRVGEVITAYCHHCAIEMSCVELARAVGFLANKGVNPLNGSVVIDPSSAKRLSALMLTCGTYDAAGDFAFRVGLPAKSGVGGGIVAILPGECGICVWSPALEESGNSHAGSMALEMFTSLTGRSIF